MNNKIEIFKSVGGWRDSAANRYWNRFNIFLTIHTGLWAILFLSKPPLLIKDKIYLGSIVITLIGIILSYIWRKTLYAAKYYEHCWYISMKNLINDCEELKKYIHLYDHEADKDIVRTKYKSTDYANFVTYLFQIIWSLFFVYYVISSILNLS